ncbi:hypothetical protein ABW20_dc0104974 [Dactylellina cionopaga]|nr:hypothetical protein ABW20_dc0104974 [Dactylellina cionopaga]
MPTQLFRPARLLALLHLLALTLAAGTTYKCNSETAPMFHQDCAVAANQLVLSLTRDDGQTHLPNDDIMHTVGNCQATLRATGGEQVVQGTSLLLSFAQLGSRCQDGTFSSGPIQGTLKGAAGWKRSGRSLQERAVAVKRAMSSPLRFFRRNMHGTVTPTPRRGEMMAARKGKNGDTYRLMMVSAHGVPGLAPSSSQVSSMFFQRSREFLQHHFQREDMSDLVFGNSYPIEVNGKPHVSVATLGVKLRNGQSNWKSFVDGQSDGGKTVKMLVADGITMFTTNKYVAAYFDVLNSNGLKVFSFMVYGYDSVDSPLPK